MKRIIALLIFSLGIFFFATTTSCSPKTGCPINEQAHVTPNKKGKYPKSRTRSGLYPKKMTKKKKKK